MFKTFIVRLINQLGYTIDKTENHNYFELPEDFDLTAQEVEIWKNFRNPRYTLVNEMRWRLFLQTGISIRGLTVFEPGAGIGDQTQWLLNMGASKVIVSDGRDSNVAIIKKRFKNEPKVVTLVGDLEDCLGRPDFNVQANLIFLWGVYYHINDPMPEFPILKKLASIAPLVAFDYLESSSGKDYVETYDYENPSASISHASGRPTQSMMVAGLRKSFPFVYFPREQMNWHDPSAPHTPRKIIVGSATPLNYAGLVESA